MNVRVIFGMTIGKLHFLKMTPENALKFYVYKLIDPRNGMTFYVGKGKGNRVFEHINAAIEIGDDEDDLSLKLEVIREIIKW